MTDTDTVQWEHTRAHAILAFKGELPRPETEAAIIDIFEQIPEAVINAITEVADAKANGKARSGWAVLHARLEGALDPTRQATAQIGDNRQLRIRQAENYLRNAALYLPTEDEVIAELYDAHSSGHRNSSHALLHPWRDDEHLRERMLDLWRSLQPQAEATRQATIDRGQAWQQVNTPPPAASDDIPL